MRAHTRVINYEWRYVYETRYAFSAFLPSRVLSHIPLLVYNSPFGPWGVPNVKWCQRALRKRKHTYYEDIL